MERKVPVSGLLRYRDDLGQGVRTGVFLEERNQKLLDLLPPVYRMEPLLFRQFTPAQLFDVIRKEDHDYLSDRVNITLLGSDPLLSYAFVREFVDLASEKDFQTDLFSPLFAGEEALFQLMGHIHLFTFTLFSLEEARVSRLCSRDLKKILSTLRCADRIALPYRLRVPVRKGLNADEAESFAIFSSMLKNVKSVILDFDASFSAEEKEEYRAPFRRRGVILY